MSNTKTIYLVRGGSVVDAHVAPADATVALDGSAVSWSNGSFPATPGVTYFDQANATIGWTVQNGALVAPPAPARSLAELGQELISAADSACTAITLQVVPDDIHQQAYTNAAAVVLAAGGKAPLADPLKSAFAAQASALALTPDAFAAVVQSVTLVSLQLGAALSTLRGSVAAAKAASDLATAITVFETSLSSIISALQGAGLTVPIKAPGHILISGINA